jgi:NarL family two-component system sensor histidine kinase LiaS
LSSARTVGIQWRLTLYYLLIVLGMALLIGGGFALGQYLRLSPALSLGIGLALGLTLGFSASIGGLMTARQVKLRLWEAGDMARRIARGDLSARLTTNSSDELGWLEQQLNLMAIHLETAVRELKDLAEQNRLLSDEARRGTALEERAKLSRDLHDTVNQRLFALSMRMAALRIRLEQMGLKADLVNELKELEAIARDAHSQTRELILSLRPPTLEQQGLGPALEEYVKLTSAKENWQVIMDINKDIKIKGNVGEALFRLAQEALHNVAKHARARSVRVELTQTDEKVQLTIDDDGVGFYAEGARKPTAIGITAMKERMNDIGGTLEIHSVKGKGTRVQASIPLTDLKEVGI